MEHLGGRKDRLSADMIPASLDASAAYQINFTTDDVSKLVLHVHHVEEGGMGFRIEGYQDIHIAVWPEILAKDRPKERKFRYPPALTKLAYDVFVYCYPHTHFSIPRIATK
jgi:hypothetical protein